MNIFNGTEIEFEEIIEKNKAAVYGTVYAYFPYNSDVDDVVQETFIQAYFNYGSIKNKDNIGAWLCGVARNIALKKLRATRYHLSLDSVMEKASEDLESRYIKIETSIEIKKAISSLSKPIAETIILYYFSGKNIREISSLLSVSEGTIKSRLHDGRKKLKGELIHIMKEQGNRLEEKDVINEVKLLIQKAEKEGKINRNAVALAHCDEAIAKLGKSSAEYKTLAQIYKIRARAIGYSQREKMIESMEKSVQYAKLSGDKKLICECLLDMAFYENYKKWSPYFLEAYELAKQIGYNEICCECAMWLGADNIHKMEYSEGEKYINNALEHYKNIDSKASVNCCAGDSVRVRAFANAALKSMKMLRDENRLNGNYVSLNTFCQLLRVDEDCIKADNNYGWDIPGKQSRLDHLSRANGAFTNGQTDCVILSTTLMEKNDYLCEYYDYHTGILINVKYNVISRNTAVTMPAGTFENCLHIRTVEEIADYDPENELHAGVHKDMSVREYWYAENVGMIKQMYSYPNDPESCPTTFIELHSYEVVASEKAPQKYLPLVQGNKWEYVFYNENYIPYSNFVKYRDCYEVDVVTDEFVYISNSGYLYTD